MVAFWLLAWPLASLAAPDWYACKTATDCVVAKGGCGVEWAVSSKFLAESRKSPPRADGPCKKALESHPSDTAALCLDGQCRLDPAGTLANGKTVGGEACEKAACWGHLGCNYFTCKQADGKVIQRYAR